MLIEPSVKKETLVVDVQNAIEEPSDTVPPSDALVIEWANAAHTSLKASPSEVTVRLVDEAEMTELNQMYRGKTGSTNVLSFPVDNEFAELVNSLEQDSDQQIFEGQGFEGQSFETQDAEEMMPQLLGDIVICHAVIEREAKQQNKALLAHYAHMVTHGILHLHGYDHLDDPSAEQMEALEVNILSQSGFENPYT